MARSHKQDFQQWVQRNNVTVLDTLPDSNLRKGQMVMFTNDYGVTFGAHEILGFTSDGRVYFDHDAYWHPAKPEQLTHAEDGNTGKEAAV